MKLNLSVILAHVLLIGILVFANKPQQSKPSPIKVNTYLMQTPTQEQAEPVVEIKPIPQTQIKPAQPKQVVKKPIPQTEVKPAQPKQIVKKPIPQTEVKPAQVVKTTPNQAQLKKEKLISLLQEGLEPIHASSSTEQNKKIGTLRSETLSFKTNYEQELMLYLQTLLTLPEKGEVKLLCTINRNGTLHNLKILASSCERNTLYVKEMLSNITLPSFGSHFASETTHTFSLVFTSEDSH